MASGYSLHIGLNELNQFSYRGISPLAACVNDANDYYALAEKVGFEAATLCDDCATYGKVVNAIADKASRLEAGDIFWITYSGHGSQVPDTNGDEADGLDETWCLYDRQIVDDKLFDLWSRFKEGVRIVIFSDSCHSGTIARSINSLNPVEIPPVMKASGILISGCQDHQLSMEGVQNGAFTEAFLQVYGKSGFGGSYKRLRSAIAAKLPANQSPNYLFFGKPNTRFTREKVLTI
jgi:hypothetical protein